MELDTIQAKVGQPVHLHITSDDVVHGFAIGKSDQPSLEIIPGSFTDTTLTFDQPGKYTFYCTRWCGSNHWRMRGTIEVTGEGQPLPTDPQPLFVQLGINIDSPEAAGAIPATSCLCRTRGPICRTAPCLCNRPRHLSYQPARQNFGSDCALSLL